MRDERKTAHINIRLKPSEREFSKVVASALGMVETDMIVEAIEHYARYRNVCVDIQKNDGFLSQDKSNFDNVAA